MKIRQNFTVLNTLLSLMLGFGFSSAGLASPSTSHASTAVSAKRDKGIPASIYIRAFQKANKAWPGNTDSVLGHKTPIDAAAWGAIPELGSAHLLNSFITARQARPLKDYQGQTRRASWRFTPTTAALSGRLWSIKSCAISSLLNNPLKFLSLATSTSKQQTLLMVKSAGGTTSLRLQK